MRHQREMDVPGNRSVVGRASTLRPFALTSSVSLSVVKAPPRSVHFGPKSRPGLLIGTTLSSFCPRLLLGFWKLSVAPCGGNPGGDVRRDSSSSLLQRRVISRLPVAQRVGHRRAAGRQYVGRDPEVLKRRHGRRRPAVKRSPRDFRDGLP